MIQKADVSTQIAPQDALNAGDWITQPNDMRLGDQIVVIREYNLWQLLFPRIIKRCYQIPKNPHHVRRAVGVMLLDYTTE